MEKYQNDFDEDKLLCLAQAYSNIELMNCSYPDPVMLKVRELSKSLRGCSCFKKEDTTMEAERDTAVNNGKRNSTDEDSHQPSKFAKFSSVSPSETKPEAIFNNEASIVAHTSAYQPECSYDENSFDGDGNFYFRDVREPDSRKTRINCIHFILRIPASQDLEKIKLMSDALKKYHVRKEAFKVIEDATSYLGVHDYIKFKFNTSQKVCWCKFYIGNTLVGLGRGKTRKIAQAKVSDFGVKILYNLSDLPANTLDNLKNLWLQGDFKLPLKYESSTENSVLNTSKKNFVLSEEESMSHAEEPDKSSLQFWFIFAEIIKKCVGENKPAEEVIREAANLVNISNVSFFNFGEDFNRPFYRDSFCCDLVIENVLVCQGNGFAEENAKRNAARRGVLNLISLGEWCKDEFADRYNTSGEAKDINRNSPRSMSVPICKEENSSILSNGENSALSENELNNNKTALETSCSIDGLSKDEKPNITKISNTPLIRENAATNSLSSSSEGVCGEPFVPNRTLLNNSYQRQLVALDTRGAGFIKQQTPEVMLKHSAKFCNKTMKYERGYVLFDGEEIGRGEAKSRAFCCALENLRTSVYTVKVKKVADGIVLSRKLLKGDDTPSDTKEIKVKSEPTEKSKQERFNFTWNRRMNFKLNMDSLIKEFTKSKSIGDLIFDTDFSKKERKAINGMVKRYNLVRYKDKDDENQLIVKRKIPVTEFLNTLVQAGGSTAKYELIDNSIY